VIPASQKTNCNIDAGERIMKASELFTLATLAVVSLNVSAKDFSSEKLQQRMIERRAVEAVIWGMPIVSLDAMRQAYFRDGKAKYGDIIWWPKGNQSACRRDSDGRSPTISTWIRAA
jgi:hypothetical protein